MNLKISVLEMMNGIDREKWIKGWSELMVDIWHEKLVQLYVGKTGALSRSIEEYRFIGTGDSFSITHAFRYYGIYVDRGTGKEFKKGNQGDLGFTPVREPKKWFSLKYYASYMNLKEFLERSYGEDFVLMMKETLEK